MASPASFGVVEVVERILKSNPKPLSHGETGRSTGRSVLPDEAEHGARDAVAEREQAGEMYPMIDRIRTRSSDIALRAAGRAGGGGRRARCGVRAWRACAALVVVRARAPAARRGGAGGAGVAAAQQLPHPTGEGRELRTPCERSGAKHSRCAPRGSAFWREEAWAIGRRRRRRWLGSGGGSAARVLATEGAARAGAALVDMGAGFQALRRWLPRNVTYVPVDTDQRVAMVAKVPTPRRAPSLDLNKLEFPKLDVTVGAFVFLGSLEYLLDRLSVRRLCRLHNAPVLAAYLAREDVTVGAARGSSRVRRAAQTSRSPWCTWPRSPATARACGCSAPCRARTAPELQRCSIGEAQARCAAECHLWVYLTPVTVD